MMETLRQCNVQAKDSIFRLYDVSNHRRSDVNIDLVLPGSIWSDPEEMMTKPPKTHNNGKYCNGKHQYLRFRDNNEMIYEYIPP